MYFLDGNFLVMIFKDFHIPYPIVHHKFKHHTKKVAVLGEVELPLLGYNFYGDKIGLYFYHPEFPTNVLFWEQRGKNIYNEINTFLKKNNVKDMDFKDILPIVKLSQGQTKMLYDNPYVIPKLEIVDFIEYAELPNEVKGVIGKI